MLLICYLVRFPLVVGVPCLYLFFKLYFVSFLVLFLDVLYFVTFPNVSWSTSELRARLVP